MPLAPSPNRLAPRREVVFHPLSAPVFFASLQASNAVFRCEPPLEKCDELVNREARLANDVHIPRQAGHRFHGKPAASDNAEG